MYNRKGPQLLRSFLKITISGQQLAITVKILILLFKNWRTNLTLKRENHLVACQAYIEIATFILVRQIACYKNWSASHFDIHLHYNPTTKLRNPHSHLLYNTHPAFS